ncbi:ATPase AAA [Methanocella arvoryzae]|uniref:DNA helicase n=1 Tax=Methanocella arvoryzae (strain DSM 22066 / NBRC 105507 / MRE50) TaxID=351160 RepID=Q0W2N3_METAR|nr:ATPase AAA [Methanocella arvoryzae]CAJ37360.1 putative DNA replication licensing factor [Methanocella arvoryzae MRE50]
MAASVISSVARWKEFLTRYYKNQIQQLAVSDVKNKALAIEFPNITKFDVRLAEELLNNPDLVLSHAEDALTLVDLPVKTQVSAKIRVIKVPRKTQVRELRSSDVNKLVSLEGTVRKITDVRPRILEAAFECARCKNIIYIPQEGSGKFIEPSYCQCNEEKKGIFRLMYKESRFEDYQRIKIQESPENLKGGEQPQTLDINVSDDLAGIVTPGEFITVTGILRSAQRVNKDGKTAYFDIYLDGVAVELEEQEFDEVEISLEDEEEILRMSRDPEIYQKVIGSIAPSIYGYDEVKEAVAHQLFSGVVKELPDGSRIRGDIHVLLVGDPGIAKSQILRYVVKLAPRGVYASGKSASSAGLTAAAVKDEFDGQWTLEAGALVLADKGIAAIDEMDKMKNEDRSSLHEGMEQQSYHPLTEILLADGRKIRIGDLFDQTYAKADEIIEGIDCEIVPCEGVSVLSTDMNHITEQRVDRVSRHKAPDHFIKIRYSNDREIIVTPEHPVFIVKDGISCIPASAVTIGDPVPAPVEEQTGSKICSLYVTAVEVIPNEGQYRTDYVYDVTVEPYHCFVSQGVILHNSISIAKAGILATLKCRCAILGAANPKLGRFDPYESIPDQINMPPSLMSRFDLIFILQDKPEEKRDTNIAGHILKSHFAGELHEHRKNNPASHVTDDMVRTAMSTIKPQIDPKLFRKYVAYAKRKVFPIMTEDAKAQIINFYLGLRKQGEGDNAPIPVTARQLEGLVRLAEASARMRLSDKVTADDVARTIRITMTSLKQVGMDTETGRLDIDVLQVGVAKSQRDRIKNLKHLIEDLSREYEGSVPVDVLIDRAVESGMPKDKVEKELKKLREIGEIFEPKSGHLSLS